MPYYVQRDHTGKIVGLYASPQPQPDGTCLTEPDPLPDDHSEVIEYLKQHPTPSISPLTMEEIKRLNVEYERLQRETSELRNAVLGFMQNWAQLETAQSCLLYELLDIQPRSSHIAHAIYHSPESFQARANIVDDVFIQFTDERKGQAEIETIYSLWQKLEKKIKNGARKWRNHIAHSSISTFNIKNKSMVSLAPPAFDVVRIWRRVAEGSSPGMSVIEVQKSVVKIRGMTDCIDHMNKVIVAFRVNEREPLLQRLRILEADLKKLDDQ